MKHLSVSRAGWAAGLLLALTLLPAGCGPTRDREEPVQLPPRESLFKISVADKNSNVFTKILEMGITIIYNER